MPDTYGCDFQDCGDPNRLGLHTHTDAHGWTSIILYGRYPALPVRAEPVPTHFAVEYPDATYYVPVEYADANPDLSFDLGPNPYPAAELSDSVTAGAFVGNCDTE